MSGLPSLRKSSERSKKQSKPVHRYEVDLSNYKKQQLIKNGAFGYVYHLKISKQENIMQPKSLIIKMMKMNATK